jgi:four helix bundle protein
MVLATYLGMGVKNLEDLQAYQLALAFKLECYKLVHEHPRAAADFKFVDQLFDAASGGEMNIGEGFDRFVAGDMVRFLRIAISSIREAKLRVKDGVHRRYFTDAEAARAQELGERARRASIALHNSLLPFVKKGHASLWDDPSPSPAKKPGETPAAPERGLGRPEPRRAEQRPEPRTEGPEPDRRTRT